MARSPSRLPSPLPDDRFTLTINDAVVDPAGNKLDGESNAAEPNEAADLPQRRRPAGRQLRRPLHRRQPAGNRHLERRQRIHRHQRKLHLRPDEHRRGQPRPHLYPGLHQRRDFRRQLRIAVRSRQPRRLLETGGLRVGLQRQLSLLVHRRHGQSGQYAARKLAVSATPRTAASTPCRSPATSAATRPSATRSACSTGPIGISTRRAAACSTPWCPA